MSPTGRCDFCFPSHELRDGEMLLVRAEEVATFHRAYAALFADAMAAMLRLEGNELTALQEMGTVAAGIDQATGLVRATITDWSVCPAAAARWAAYKELYPPRR